MATAKQTITEVDVVAFREAIDKLEGTGKWPAGTEGAVVIDYGDHKMVEVSNDLGEALDFPVVPEEKLELIAMHRGPLPESPASATKKRLHTLIDQLDETEAKRALTLLEKEREDPMIAAFRDAPEDDEPWTEEDEAAMAEVEADRAAGVPVIPMEQVMRRFGDA
jgi:hypothetical protein